MLCLVLHQRLSIEDFDLFFHLTEKERHTLTLSFPLTYDEVNMTDGCDLFAAFEQRLSGADCLSIVS